MSTSPNSLKAEASIGGDSPCAPDARLVGPAPAVLLVVPLVPNVLRGLLAERKLSERSMPVRPMRLLLGLPTVEAAALPGRERTIDLEGQGVGAGAASHTHRRGVGTCQTGRHGACLLTWHAPVCPRAWC